MSDIKKTVCIKKKFSTTKIAPLNETNFYPTSEFSWKVNSIWSKDFK